MNHHARTLARWSHHWLFDGDTWIPDRQHDAVSLEVRAQRRTRLRLLEAKERWSGLDDVHSAAKTGECLSELDADGAPAKHGEGHWQLSRNRRLPVGPEFHGVEAGNRRDRRGTAICDHDGATRDELLVSNGH